jgi:hypothetical protein
MDRVFWIGLYPGLGPETLDYMLDALHSLATQAVRAGV